MAGRERARLVACWPQRCTHRPEPLLAHAGRHGRRACVRPLRSTFGSSYVISSSSAKARPCTPAGPGFGFFGRTVRTEVRLVDVAEARGGNGATRDTVPV